MALAQPAATGQANYLSHSGPTQRSLRGVFENSIVFQMGTKGRSVFLNESGVLNNGPDAFTLG